MIKPGLCSVTLRNCPAAQVIECAKAAGLSGIEWAGNAQVPHGDLRSAREVGKLCADAGIECPSYGSYYRVGVSEAAGLPFQSVLESAAELGVANLRVWAGEKNFEEADEAHVEAVMVDSNRIADLAAREGIAITFEFHTNSLTNRGETARELARILPHPNIFFSWQPQHGYRCEFNLISLGCVLPRLSTLHVFHWTIGAWEDNIVNESIRPIVYPQDFHIHPLQDGAANWERYFELAKTTGRDHWAFLEFVQGDSVDQVVQDASTLRAILDERSSG